MVGGARVVGILVARFVLSNSVQGQCSRCCRLCRLCLVAVVFSKIVFVSSLFYVMVALSVQCVAVKFFFTQEKCCRNCFNAEHCLQGQCFRFRQSSSVQ